MASNNFRCACTCRKCRQKVPTLNFICRICRKYHGHLNMKYIPSLGGLPRGDKEIEGHGGSNVHNQ